MKGSIILIYIKDLRYCKLRNYNTLKKKLKIFLALHVFDVPTIIFCPGFHFTDLLDLLNNN